MKSRFDPKLNGLPYRNGSFKFKVGPASCSVLCGGISYTAMDYFDTGIKPPESSKTPVDGNPMETYLYRRQMTAHFYTWHRFLNAWSVSHIPLLGGLAGEQDKVEELDNYLASRPVIICLYGGPGHGHHVIATGCDRARKEISLYDSNHPGVTSKLTAEDGHWRHDQSNTLWYGWFMDWGQYTDGDRQPPLAYRYCRTCHGLNTHSLGVEGVCVGGGGHDNNLDLEYFLPWERGEGQGGWTVCSRCQGLYRQDSSTPMCPSGGLHFPQAQNPNWKEVRIRTNGSGETNWKRCNACTSLFWTSPNGDTGQCVGGGKHDPTGSDSYIIDNRTT
ncbi:hypothetical protein ACYOEI_25960 [Singulisphaera rosea]